MVVRDARPEDALAIARVHVRSWQIGDRGLLPDGYLVALKPEDRAARYTLGSPDPNTPATIAAESPEIVGFVTTAPARDLDAGKGELAALYVEPTRWEQGIGAALLEAAHRRLVGRGFTEWVLWLLAGNERGLRFYRRNGWLLNGRKRSEEVWGVKVEEVQLERRLPEPGKWHPPPRSR